MAPIGVKQKSPDKGENNAEKDKENLWSSILEEVQNSERTKLPSYKQVLVLGDNECGKTTLIAKLQGNEDPKKGVGLEYAYIDVRDEYRDDQTRLGVWVLDGDQEHSHLLQFALTESKFAHTLVLLTVSMTTPWNVMDCLHSWATILQDHIDRLPLSTDFIKEHQFNMVKRWQDYMEPGDELEATPQVRRTSRHLNDDVVIPLGENVLNRNLGMDVIVVLTKTDYMTTLEKDYDYKDEHFDFIQQSIRKFCLQYGAALFYTSVKEDKNCDLLYKYLVHRIYGFPFRTPALVVEKDAVFVPSGWDNEKKISILYENMHSMKPDDYYTDIIARPVLRKPAVRDAEVVAEEEQAFLSRQQSLLQSSGGGSQSAISAQSVGGRSMMGAADAALRTQVPKTGEPRRVGPGQTGSPKKTPVLNLEGATRVLENKPGGAATSEGVLANFFNSLLNKKTGAATSPSLKPPGQGLVRSDAAAELDRLTRAKKNVATTENHSAHNSSEC